jgi:hypothetical protein
MGIGETKSASSINTIDKGGINIAIIANIKNRRDNGDIKGIKNVLGMSDVNFLPLPHHRKYIRTNQIISLSICTSRITSTCNIQHVEDGIISLHGGI